MNKKFGFTLAEVLITLAIIGVVAALTLPTLITNYREKQYVTALKKAYANLSNAYQLVLTENQGGNDFGITLGKYNNDKKGHENVDVAAKILFEKFKPYLNIVKECDGVKVKGCWAKVTDNNREWDLEGSENGARYFAQLLDGSSIAVYGVVTRQAIYVDINGLNGPNKVGVDVFQFDLGKKSLELYDKDNTGIPTCYDNQWTCARWVIENENMDYLHCNDLNYSTKTKCH